MDVIESKVFVFYQLPKKYQMCLGPTRGQTKKTPLFHHHTLRHVHNTIKIGFGRFAFAVLHHYGVTLHTNISRQLQYYVTHPNCTYHVY